jgi:hypothetical protein
MATTNDTNHAQENARGHLEQISQLHRLSDWAQDDSLPASGLAWSDRARLRELAPWGANLSPHASRGRGRDGLFEAIEQEAQEQPLSVEVRGAWHAPSEQPDEQPDEWKILLTWGGPALRLRGDFGRHGEPTNPAMEYQDWSTPWTLQDTTSEEDEALCWFAGLFLPS